MEPASVLVMNDFHFNKCGFSEAMRTSSYIRTSELNMLMIEAVVVVVVVTVSVARAAVGMYSSISTVFGQPVNDLSRIFIGPFKEP